MSSKSKRELVAEIVGSKHSNSEPPFRWQEDNPIIPMCFHQVFDSEIINYAIMDNMGIILPKEHWDEIKCYVDNFYELAEENNFDIDRHNLENLAKMYRERYSSSNKSQNKPTKEPGSIYLLKGNGFYKIGKAQNPVSRTDTLTVKLPFEVELIHTVKSDQYSQLEKFLHDKFSNKRVNGEWFDLNQGDIEYIKNLDGGEYNEQG